ncbi:MULTISPECIES: DUF397 domain-containing protein [unclassified Streptomyces]|uniref:DUF397 domain-containing protein n=1 Tax=unclassified Streptomyces TaxID=2593676 RepID=UPI000DBA6114|nr:DUF397 domain-containing protein [Streptomyces sp. KhCrAH-43]MYS36143.1 DUF397 domain-containing protein [Streptomyces sp. SID4920]MYX70772.1 DUF397 domain-containing protein [Streptomyces sp. SID8373]
MHVPCDRHTALDHAGYSNGGDCLEVADGHPGLVPVRDSKRPDGPALLLDAAAWAPFIASVKAA